MGCAAQPKSEAKVSLLVAEESRVGVDGDFVNFLRRGFSHVFNVHSAFRRRHDEHRLFLAVDQDGQIVFMGDVATSFDVEVADQFSFRSRLNGYQYIAEDVAGVGFDLVFGEGDFHATFHDEVARVGGVKVSLATTTSVNL